MISNHYIFVTLICILKLPCFIKNKLHSGSKYYSKFKVVVLIFKKINTNLNLYISQNQNENSCRNIKNISLQKHF